MVRLYTPTEEIATLEEAPKNIGVKVGLSTQSEDARLAGVVSRRRQKHCLPPPC